MKRFKAPQFGRIIPIISFVGFLSGCQTERVYTYVQKKDGIAAKAPITFTVRIHVDKAKKVVTWMQDGEDASGITDRQIITYGSNGWWDVCEIFDDNNWQCEMRAPNDGDVVQRPEMKDGVLSRFYWNNTERYTRRWW